MAVIPAIKDNFFMYNSCSKFFLSYPAVPEKEDCPSESIILVFEKINHGFIKYLQTFADFEKRSTKHFFRYAEKTFMRNFRIMNTEIQEDFLLKEMM